MQNFTLTCHGTYGALMFTNRMAFCSQGRKREDHAEELSFLLSVMVAFIAIKMLYNTYICISGLFTILFITYFTVQYCVYSSFHLGPEIRLPMHCIMDNSGFRFFQESVKYK